MSGTVRQLPGIARTDLQRHDLSTPGREVVQNRVDIGPEAPFIRYTHPGEEIIYVLEGSLEYHLEGQEPTTLNTGDVLLVPAETVHAVKNVGSGTASELATYFVERDKPFLVVVGESLPVSKSPGSELTGATINLNGTPRVGGRLPPAELTVRWRRISWQTYFTKCLADIDRGHSRASSAHGATARIAVRSRDRSCSASSAPNTSAAVRAWCTASRWAARSGSRAAAASRMPRCSARPSSQLPRPPNRSR
jgi:quercetin dioxygenase-like cupin family protein